MKTLIIAVLACAVPCSATAQSLFTRAATTPPQEREIERAWFRQLFKGIRLTQQQDSAARKIVRRSILDRAAVDETSPEFQTRVMEILQRRNQQLLLLLSLEHDKEQFGNNTKSPIFVLDVSRPSP